MKKLLIFFTIIFTIISPINSYAQINKNYTIGVDAELDELRREFYIAPLLKPIDGYSVKELYTHMGSLNLDDYQEPLFIAKTELNAIDNNKLQLILGVILMLGVCMVRVFVTPLPKDYLPWVTVMITMLLFGVMGIFGGWPGEKIFIDAIMLSTSAGGLWSLIGKHMLNLDY